MKSPKSSPTRIIKRNEILQQCLHLEIKKTTYTLPPVPLPFPPQFNTTAFVTKLSRKKLARFPNAFIMYRSEYVRHLKNNNYHLSMTDLSSMISYSWRKEPEYVKKAYRDISSDAERLYAQTTCFRVNDATTAVSIKKTKPTFIATISMQVQKPTTNNFIISKNPVYAPRTQPMTLQASESALPPPQSFVQNNYFEPINSVCLPFDILENRMGTTFDNRMVNCCRCLECAWKQQHGGNMTASAPQKTDAVVPQYSSSITTTSHFVLIQPSTLFTHQTTSQFSLPSPPIFNHYGSTSGLSLSLSTTTFSSSKNEGKMPISRKYNLNHGLADGLL
ncbi:3343_t:CDS:2 [Paraglomus brasilianum]|uniref:3343_t:CDS:1 n=1 Tax=Paraglomus brasilianum TaxID=144538 RepID=A0A9N9B2F2_9GLOM|nr:3343_t:CDS:2 [Paraglomus brasilianum]